VPILEPQDAVRLLDTDVAEAAAHVAMLFNATTA
jgi:hypothetical protein